MKNSRNILIIFTKYLEANTKVQMKKGLFLETFYLLLTWL